MKAGDVKRALANEPDDAEVTVDADSIRLAPGDLFVSMALCFLLRKFADRDLQAYRERMAGS